MKLTSFAGIGIRLLTIPLVLVLAAYLALGIGVYFFWAPSFLKDFHNAQLRSVAAGNRSAIDLWLDYRKRAIESMARDERLGAILRDLTQAQESLERLPEKRSAADEREALRLARVISDARERFSETFSHQSQFRSAFFIASNGTVLAGTMAEAAGQNWSGAEVFGKIPPGRGISIVAGKSPLGGQAQEVYFIAPVAADGLEITTYLFCRPDPSELASYLKPERGSYETVRLSIIDKSGLVVAALDMSEAGRVRYNVPRQGMEGVDYREGLYFYVTPLRFEGVGLIATLQASEAAKPLKPLRTLYFAFAGFIVVIWAVHRYAIVPVFVDKPVSRLVRAAQAVGTGDLRFVNVRKGFSGEFRELAEALSQMVIGLSKHWSVSDRTSRSAEGARFRASVADLATADIRARLEEISKGLDGLREMPAGTPDTKAAAETLSAEVKAFLGTLGDLAELVKLKDGFACLTREPVGLCSFLRAIEASSSGLIGHKETQLVIECSEELEKRPVYIDSKCLERIVQNVLRNAVRLTEVGTITIFASLENRGAGEVVELSVSDVGKGTGSWTATRITKGGGFVPGQLELSMAREYAEMIGATLDVSGSTGQGTLAVLTIPLTQGAEGAAGEPSERTESN